MDPTPGRECCGVKSPFAHWLAFVFGDDNTAVLPHETSAAAWLPNEPAMSLIQIPRTIALASPWPRSDSILGSHLRRSALAPAQHVKKSFPTTSMLVVSSSKVQDHPSVLYRVLCRGLAASQIMTFYLTIWVTSVRMRNAYRVYVAAYHFVFA